MNIAVLRQESSCTGTPLALAPRGRNRRSVSRMRWQPARSRRTSRARCARGSCVRSLGKAGSLVLSACSQLNGTTSVVGTPHHRSAETTKIVRSAFFVRRGVLAY